MINKLGVSVLIRHNFHVGYNNYALLSKYCNYYFDFSPYKLFSYRLYL
jgi:hypothetical protein